MMYVQWQTLYLNENSKTSMEKYSITSEGPAVYLGQSIMNPALKFYMFLFFLFNQVYYAKKQQNTMKTVR